MANVTNLRTKEKRVYSCDARSAVIAAYAQDNNDNNTWGYESRYGPLVQTGTFHVFCGDWGCRQDRVNDATMQRHRGSLPTIEAVEEEGLTKHT